MESLSQAIFKITGLKDIGVTNLTFLGLLTSSMTLSFDPPQAIVTESPSRAVFEIMGLKDIGVTTLNFQGHVTSSMTSSFSPPQAIFY